MTVPSRFISRLAALALLAGVFIMEGFDIAAMGIAVPRLEGALGLAPASFGWVFTGILVGLGVGGATPVAHRQSLTASRRVRRAPPRAQRPLPCRHAGGGGRVRGA